MKYGCLYWKNSDNIGDDIQTYAQKRFLPSVDYLVDREYLSLFQSKGHEKVACILNAWYLYSEGTAWPPTDDIVPLPISMHFTPSLSFLTEDQENAQAGQIEYLKQYAPIGCRDTTTLSLLQNKQIPAYFSGCMTLTIEPFEGILPSDEILLIDVPEQIQEYIKSKFPSVKIDSHQNEELFHESFECRMQQVENRLKRYQAAKLVVSTRLHCCMPCLALGTPVLLVYDGKESERYEGLRQYAHVAGQKDILDGKWDSFFVNPQPNGTEFKKIADKLKETVRHFIACPEEYIRDSTWDRYPLYCKQMEIISQKEHEERELFYSKLDQVQEAWDFVRKYERDAKTLFQKIDVANAQIVQLKQHNEELETQCAALKQHAEQLEQEMERIYDSKTWKLCRKIQQFRHPARCKK